MSSSSDFEWSEYLSFAKTLVDDPDAEESALRSAISRAYYAAFHGAKALVLIMGKHVPSTGDAHGKVWHLCRNECGIAVRKIGNSGKNLKDDRTKADYDNPFPENLRKKTESALISADYIVSESRRIWGLKAGK